MRMDRYEDEFKSSDSKQTRTNKNQELYTDVYLNNVYVDINNLKDVVHEDIEEEKEEEIKFKRDTSFASYSYEDKNYDSVSLMEETIKNKKDDKVKRNLDFSENEIEIANLIESINENQKEETSFKEENLLSDLMPNNENTTVIPPLEEPILDTSLIKGYKEESDEVSFDMLDDDIVEKDLDLDDSFIENNGSKLKVIIPILVILLIVGVIIAFLF